MKLVSKSLILFLCKINIFHSSAWKKHPHPHGGGEEEAEPAQLVAPKGFCCRLCFPKQPSSSSDHLQGAKNKNKTKRGSRWFKGSIWMVLRMGDDSRTWPCLASAVPIATRDRQREDFLHLVGSGGLQEPPNVLCASGLGSEALQAAGGWEWTWCIPALGVEGWMWAGIVLWVRLLKRAADAASLPHAPRTPPVSPALPSPAQACFAHGCPILEFQAERGFHSQQQHIVPQFPLPQKHAGTFP